jgi:hypothetical protein
MTTERRDDKRMPRVIGLKGVETREQPEEKPISTQSSDTKKNTGIVQGFHSLRDVTDANQGAGFIVGGTKKPSFEKKEEE